MNNYVVIVAGGTGSRMKSDRPKQFIELDGIPIIIRTIRQFLEFEPSIRIVISVHRNYRAHLEGLIEKYGLKNNSIAITVGGETRFESVKNGLSVIEDEQGIVGIHDAARPFVSVDTIALCYSTAVAKGNAVPSLPMNESLRKISNNVNHSVNRNEYRVIQTPQCFQIQSIKKAFATVQGNNFSDDATVFEQRGGVVVLVDGNEENIKITSPWDLNIAKALLAK